jgi:uncharacterized Ntn-hydrolase superfamily protein
MRLALAALALLIATPAFAQENPRPLRPVHTYSIVARDAETGQMGVAVQSHWFSVGGVVTWAEPGVGAVATQSFSLRSYGPLGLELMRSGMSADSALTALLAGDEHADVRQVGMVDAQGNVANHTGENSVREFCNIEGEGFAVQANLMGPSTVCTAMAAAYQAAQGDLAARMMAALEAAQAEGGDIRGQQSAAILVVSGDKTLPAWGGRIFDLRVEDHRRPLEELSRLLALARAYNLMTEGDDAVAAGDMETAGARYAAAMALAPDNHEMMFWTAVTMAGAGDIDEALPLFRRAFRLHPPWREAVTRLPEAGLLPNDPALMERILRGR